MKNSNREALIVVDYQKCFVEGWELAVNGGLALKDVINTNIALTKMRSWLVVATRDWHPSKSIHFDKWPVHAVAGTRSSEYVDGLNTNAIDIEIFKGFKNSDDGYSGFEWVTKLEWDSDSWFVITPNSKSLQKVLEDYKVSVVNVLWLATDFCVKSTLIDAKKFGFDVRFIKNWAASVFPENEDAILEEIRNTGVSIL